MRFSKTRKVVSSLSALLLGISLASVAQQEESQSASAQKVAESGTAAQRGRRDPFEALIKKASRDNGGSTRVCPAGVAGVEITTMRVDGVVKSVNGMIAVVSTPQNRVYFVHEGDRLCDGVVERITLDGLVARERGQDAFGKPVDRLVTKRLYPSAGEGR